jgi:hypothetical protein
MVLPSTVPAVVVPPALFAVSAVISIAIVGGRRRIDYGRRRLIDDGGLLHIRRRPKEHSNVHVSQSSTGSTRSGEANCE